MYVEDVQEDADPLLDKTIIHEPRHRGDLAIGRRDDHSHSIGNGALGIAKKP